MPLETLNKFQAMVRLLYKTEAIKSNYKDWLDSGIVEYITINPFRIKKTSYMLMCKYKN